jgi:hypothetical protein
MYITRNSYDYGPDNSVTSFENIAASSGILLLISLLLTIFLAPLNIASSPAEQILCRAGYERSVIHFPAGAAVYLKQRVNEVTAGFPSVMLADMPDALEANNRQWPPVNRPLKQVPMSLVLADNFYLLPAEALADDPQQLTDCVEKNGWLYVSQDLIQ